MKKVNIYTDGACLGNPGPGGYGVLLDFDGKEKELAGGFRRTTNNRMEILAAIEGLEALKESCDVTLYSDSQYVVNAIEQGWAKRWQANGWKRNAKEKAINPDLWERLLKAIAKHQVKFQWVRGHNGHIQNERVDRLAVGAAKGRDLPADRGYESQAGSGKAAR